MEEAQRLLEDQQRRAESLRTRGGQVAGFGAAVLALIGGNASTILSGPGGCSRLIIGVALLAAAIFLAAAVAIAIWGVTRPQSFATVAADEITTYGSDRFLSEPDLWRVHVRLLRTLEGMARETQEDGNAAARSITISLYAFLAGLGFSRVALGTLIIALI